MGSGEQQKHQAKSIKSMQQFGVLAFLFVIGCLFCISTHESNSIHGLESELESVKVALSQTKLEQSKMMFAAQQRQQEKEFVYPVKPPAGPTTTSSTSYAQRIYEKLGIGGAGGSEVRNNDPSSFSATKTGTESKHVFLEMYDASAVKLNDEQYIRDTFTSIVRSLGMTQVALASQAMHPQGVSAVSVLTESHMSVHTWPELGYAAFDIFTCGPTQPMDAVAYLSKAFDVVNPEISLIWSYTERGQAKTVDTDITRLQSSLYANKVLVEKKKSKYQQVEIWEMNRAFAIPDKADAMYAYASYGVNGKPDLNNRCLFIDGIMMSCLADERTYHESLIHPAMIASPNPKRVAVLGGGEGASLREILRYKSVEKAYMLELDDVVIDLCKRNLPTMSDGAYSSPHVDLRIGDAFDFFASPEAVNLDALFLDILDIDEAPRELQDKLAGSEFIKNMRKSLSEDGIIVVQMGELFGVNGANDMTNLSKQNDNQKWFIVEMLKYFNYASAYASPIPSFSGSWMFFVVTDSRTTYERFNQRNRSQLKADLKSRLDSSQLQYVDANMLMTMQGVPPIFRRHFCGLDNKRLYGEGSQDEAIHENEAKSICNWATMEGDDVDVLKSLKPGKPQIMTPTGILKTFVGRKAARA